MFSPPKTLAEIAEIVDGEIDSDVDVMITKFGSIDQADGSTLTFADNERNVARIDECGAAAAIVQEDVQVDTDIPLIRVANVQIATICILREIDAGEDLPCSGIHSTAVIASDAEIADDVVIAPHVTVGSGAVVGAGTVLCHGVYIGDHCDIGSECVIAPGVVIRRRCIVKDRVRIGPNCVIGHDGFGYAFSDGIHHKVPHAGNVIIASDVELGACTCVDRAKWGSTVIGKGSKLDNLIQVAHNVQLGEGVVMAGCSAIAGSTKVGDYVVMGGSVNIRDNITIGDRTRIGACAAVSGPCPEESTLLGIPAREASRTAREVTAIGKLPELLKRVRKLERQLASLDNPDKDLNDD